MKKNSGVSLIVLVITIIVMIIIAGAVIISLTDTNVIDKADTATQKYNKQQYKQIIGNEFAMLKTSEEAKGKTKSEIYSMLKERINNEKLNWTITSEVAYIQIDGKDIVTLFEDGTIKDGKKVILNIADGSIQLKNKGYIQGTNPLVEYDGDYIITGTTTENIVKVMEEGTYNITIKDLNIDLSMLEYISAINANAGNKATNVFVNLYIEGENQLYSGGGTDAVIRFSNAVANVDGVTNGSTLTIQGEGNLYINSKATCSSIGGSNNENVSNIIINSGNISLNSRYGTGIGARGGILNNLIINGGNIVATGGEYGHAIGGKTGSSNIIINGGKLNLSTNFSYSWGQYYALGMVDNVTINGGTIICYSKKDSGIYSDATPVVITGGSVYSTGGIAPIGNSEIAKTPISGQENVYLTELQLENLTEEVEITNFTTSDNINYGIKDMYTTSEGKIYLYLPTGERTITIKAGDKEYTGNITTGTADATEVVVLNEK